MQPKQALRAAIIEEKTRRPFGMRCPRPLGCYMLLHIGGRGGGLAEREKWLRGFGISVDVPWRFLVRVAT